MAKTKPKIPNELKQEISGTKTLQLGSVPLPGPDTGTKLKQVSQRKPSPETTDNMKNTDVNLALLRRDKIAKERYI